MPILQHQIIALKAVGVTEVILAIQYSPEVMTEYITRLEKESGVKITCSVETQAMGTAGALLKAKEHFINDQHEPFFVLNSDVMCEFPLREMLQHHKENQKWATILITQVEEPSKYGVAVFNEGKIVEFIEKPKSYRGNHVNAGVYLFSPRLLEVLRADQTSQDGTPRPITMEHHLLPHLAARDNLTSIILQGYWMDVGQPKDFLVGMIMHLHHLRSKTPSVLAQGPNIVGNVIIDPSAKIGKDCLIGPDVVIGANCVIEDGVRLIRSTLLRSVTVRSNTWVACSILGWYSTVGSWCHVEGITMVGQNVQIKDERFINGALILPHQVVACDYTKSGIIVM